jgi:hypothetical protein
MIKLFITHPIKLAAEFGTLRLRKLAGIEQRARLIVGLDVHNIHQLQGWQLTTKREESLTKLTSLGRESFQVDDQD